MWRSDNERLQPRMNPAGQGGCLQEELMALHWIEVADGPDGTPDPAECLRSEVEEYEAWADGDVYWYVLEHRADWSRTLANGTSETREGWETVESLAGLIGYDYACHAANEAWSHWSRAHTVQPATVQ